MACKLLRFVVREKHFSSGRRMGIFQAMAELRDSGKLSPEELERALALRDWFNERLAPPEKFSRSKKKNAAPRAVSWFKPAAAEHLARVREMAGILETHGIPVDAITTDKPGYVTYEDDFQVAAEPFADTGA